MLHLYNLAPHRGELQRENFDVAITHLGTTDTDGALINGIDYVAKVYAANARAGGEQVSKEVSGTLVSTLADIIERKSNDPKVQMYAAQRLFYIAEPEAATAYAEQYLKKMPSPEMLDATLVALARGTITPTAGLEQSINNAIADFDLAEDHRATLDARVKAIEVALVPEQAVENEL